LILRTHMKWIGLLAAALVIQGEASGQQSGPRDTLRPIVISNASILDGTGRPARGGSVRFHQGRILAVGNIAPLPGDSIIDAHGMTLAPGLIDAHSHHDRGADAQPTVLGAISQGITTIVIGQDGSSDIPLSLAFDQLTAHPLAVNVASYSGHNSLRDSVMGENFRRAATPQEIVRMKQLLSLDMEAGALGLSTGLEYDPGIFSTREEVLELARTAAERGGRYISHIRSEDRWFWDAIGEILNIGKETGMPVQISHMKLAMKGLWGQGDSLIRTLDRARAAGIKVTADVYPYTYWMSTLQVLFPERNFTDSVEAEFVLANVSPADGLLLGEFEPDTTLVGKTVADIARLRRRSEAGTLMALIAESMSGGESVIATGMIEPDIEAIMRWPYSGFSSDGSLHSLHPRGYGAFPRVLGRHVRERRVLTLPEAVRKMTSLTAENLGIAGRGTLAPGMAADMVLLDPGTVLDQATTTNAEARSIGILGVWVNGVRVYDGNTATGALPGQVIRRTSSQR
jgi:N-acyl-D-amino-acid deacylase